MKVTWIQIATARGKIGGHVGGGWKGIDYLRKRIVPSNPRTASQSTNRALLSSVVAAVKIALSNPATYSAWADWAAANGFRSKNGDGTQFLPPYQSCLTVSINRAQYGLPPDSAVLPTISSPAVIPGQITISQGGSGFQITASYDPGIFAHTTFLKFWIAQIAPNRAPTFGLARQSALLTGDPLGVSEEIVSEELSYLTYYDVWVSRYDIGAKEAAVPFYMGRYQLIANANTLDVSPNNLWTTGANNTVNYEVTGLGPEPTGTIDFYVNGVLEDSSGLISGAANGSYTPPADGDYDTHAVYSGDAYYAPSESPNVVKTAS